MLSAIDELLAAIEAYYDAVPRTVTRVEDIGPFTLFVNTKTETGWRYYARPSLGATSFSAEDVRRVLDRQRCLGVPEAFEWVDDTSPGLRAAAEAAGLHVRDHPLLALDLAARARAPVPPGTFLHCVTHEDDLSLVGAVAIVAFGAPGAEIGEAGHQALFEAAAGRTPDLVAFERERLRAGRTIMFAAYADGCPVAVGMHQPVGLVSEVVGVGTLPAYRRRGLACAITDLLVEDALSRGVTTVFLSADDDAVARVYERVGFRRIATACVAEPSGE
jgi:ribosomal protein S18 acetylase RimI-like enzyme